MVGWMKTASGASQVTHASVSDISVTLQTSSCNPPPWFGHQITGDVVSMGSAGS